MARQKVPKGPRVELDGPAYNELRKEVIRTNGFPRAFYANSLAYGYARLDGKDEVGAMFGDGGRRIRDRVAEVWEKAGGVVVEYQGQRRLGVIIND